MLHGECQGVEAILFPSGLNVPLATSEEVIRNGT